MNTRIYKDLLKIPRLHFILVMESNIRGKLSNFLENELDFGVYGIRRPVRSIFLVHLKPAILAKLSSYEF